MLSLVYGLMKKRKIIFKKRILIKYYFIKSFCSSLYMRFIYQASILIRVASLPCDFREIPILSFLPG